MMNSDYRISVPIPPAEIILRFLNDEPRSKMDLLNYYENYIHYVVFSWDYYREHLTEIVKVFLSMKTLCKKFALNFFKACRFCIEN